MPELPEVETIRKGLTHRIKSKKIEKVEIKGKKVVESKIQKITSTKIKGIRRRAKLIIIDLSNDKSLLAHLKLTGYFLFWPKNKKIKDDYVCLILKFKDKTRITFSTVRKFSWMKIKRTTKLDKELEKKFGVEPLSKKFTLKKFKAIIEESSRANIKTLLMDQKKIAGLGNIYAQESLYYAGIKPTRKAGSLKEQEIKKLYEQIKKVLKRALKFRGTTAENYVDVEGRKGEFASKLSVYAQKKCPKGHQIKKIKISGRGTNYCGKCQK